MELPKEIADIIKPAMEVNPADFISTRHWDTLESFKPSGWIGPFAKKALIERARQELDDRWRRTTEAHNKNITAIAHNKFMRELLTAIMKTAGVADTYNLKPPGYRRRPKSTPAGYIGDLSRTFKVGDGYDAAVIGRQRVLERIAKWEKEAEEDEAAQKRAAETEKSIRKANIELAKCIIRYELSDDATWEVVLETVRSRNKYLDLAVAGYQTRGDWSEGYYRVEAAMSRFTIEDDRDKDIAADLLGCLRSDHIDGRVFRDTKWSYDKLFDLVDDKQLVEDANTAMSHIWN